MVDKIAYIIMWILVAIFCLSAIGALYLYVLIVTGLSLPTFPGMLDYCIYGIVGPCLLFVFLMTLSLGFVLPAGRRDA